MFDVQSVLHDVQKVLPALLRMFLQLLNKMLQGDYRKFDVRNDFWEFMQYILQL